MRGASIRGKVLAVRGEKIKLEIEATDKANINYLYMYPYFPVTGSIFYSMPEIGMEAELYFATSNVEDAYIRNCFLPKIEYPVSSVKFIKTKNKKDMIINPDILLFSSKTDDGEIQNIKLTNQNIFFKSNKSLVLKANGKISIHAGAFCHICAPGMIYIEQADSLNAIRLLGNTIKMSGDHYIVSSNDIENKRKEKEYQYYNLMEASLKVLAALPMGGIDSSNMQILAAIPGVLSTNSQRNSNTGYYG